MWDKFIDELRALAAPTIAETWEPDDEQTQAETCRAIMMSLSAGIVRHFMADPEHPRFVPTLNDVFNVAAPVPDFMYETAIISGDGVYRVSGYRGTNLFTEMMVRPATSDPTNASSVGVLDIDDLTIGEDGYFSVILSETRPAGYEGDWRPLDPAAASLTVRKASYDWLNEVDSRFAIERLDKSVIAPKTSAETIRQQFARLPAFTDYWNSFYLKDLKEQRARGIIDRLEVATMKGGAAGQTYLQGQFDLKEDEALILETEIPEVARYWSVLVSDDNFSTVDWLYHQSSLNGHQAQIDEDGKFRAVISLLDPGVPNWLDLGGNAKGVVQVRWNNCSSQPTPVLTKVKLAELRNALPASTPLVTPEQRQESVRARSRGAQMRRRW